MKHCFVEREISKSAWFVASCVLYIREIVGYYDPFDEMLSCLV